jgi:hypothetical protein
MSFEQFKKKNKINLDFNDNPEQIITAYQNIFNEILLKNTYLVDEHFDKIIDSDETASPKDIAPFIASLKVLFDIWLTITSAESIVDVNRAFDVLLKEGYSVDLEQAKIEKIHSMIKEQLPKNE